MKEDRRIHRDDQCCCDCDICREQRGCEPYDEEDSLVENKELKKENE